MVVSNQRAKACLLSFASALAFLPAAVVAQESDTPSHDPEGSQGASGPTFRDTIIVTGQSLGSAEETTPLPVMVLSGEDLVHRRRGTLGETLEGLPGVHMDNFGAGASRPVIRGQTIPRIEILTDGANLFDASSVSPDHAIVTDPLLLDAIEIQRGPAAIRYGGNAVNGAINLIDSKVPKALPLDGIDGAAELRYGIADREMTTAGRVTGALGSIVLHAEGSYSNRENYDVPDEFGPDRLKDSFADSSSYAFGASWVTGKGYIGAAYTRQNAEYGLPGHSHANGVCHLHPGGVHCEAHGSFEDPFEGFDDSDTAFIDLQSERVDVRADYDDLLLGLQHARLRLSYTDYSHAEIDNDTVFSRFNNEAYDARLELTHAPLFGFVGTLGGQYTDQAFDGLNFIEAHQDQVPIQYYSENAAVFLTERRSFGAFDLELSGRYDWRKSSADYPTLEDIFGISPELFPTLSPSFQQLLLDVYNDEYVLREAQADLFSFSASGTWNAGDGYSVALSLARTQRAPSARELYVGGNNLATSSYEIGLLRAGLLSGDYPRYDPDIRETAKSVDLTFRKAGGPFEAEVGLFYQYIDDYVFARFLDEDNETGVPQRLLFYTAADTEFYGIDGQVSYQVTPAARITIFGDYVNADLRDFDDNLPRLSPGRLGARYEHVAGPLSGDIEYYHTFEQDKVAAYETPTDGYDMLNATIAYRIDMGDGADLELYARGSNLTNELAFVHSSFVKDQSPLRGRNVVFGLRTQF